MSEFLAILSSCIVVYSHLQLLGLYQTIYSTMYPSYADMHILPFSFFPCLSVCWVYSGVDTDLIKVESLSTMFFQTQQLLITRKQ